MGGIFLIHRKPLLRYKASCSINLSIARYSELVIFPESIRVMVHTIKLTTLPRATADQRRVTKQINLSGPAKLVDFVTRQTLAFL